MYFCPFLAHFICRCIYLYISNLNFREFKFALLKWVNVRLLSIYIARGRQTQKLSSLWKPQNRQFEMQWTATGRKSERKLIHQGHFDSYSFWNEEALQRWDLLILTRWCAFEQNPNLVWALLAKVLEEGIMASIVIRFEPSWFLRLVDFRKRDMRDSTLQYWSTEEISWTKINQNSSTNFSCHSEEF